MNEVNNHLLGVVGALDTPHRILALPITFTKRDVMFRNL